MVARAAAYSLEDLKPFEHVSLAAVLQCAGNGRAYFEPRIPGVPWERGAVGNARWGGVRLRDLLGAAGLERGVTHVHFYGGDPPPHPKTPAFVRSLPIERVLDPTTLLATTTNGEPLPILHGGPVRLVVPGWTGNHWIKWVRAIVASNEEAPGFYQRTAYRMPKTPVAPGTEVPPEDTSPVTWLNVKSLIALPAKGTRTLVRPLEIQGVAWTGQGRVERVEVGEDRGPWQTATLVGPDEPFAWRQWTFRWSALPGPEKLRGLRVRATDSRGNVQPERSPWNKSGYQWNGYDRVEVEVVA
jgi:DMSO/TMAO reductase YedYZ molybdopterin-dependent catalytic subunit